jgi:hypothetical protein
MEVSMTFSALLFGLALFGQARFTETPSQPATRFVPRTAAPATRFDDEESGGVPVRPRYEEAAPRDTRIRTTLPATPRNAADDERMAPVGRSINQKMRPPEIMAEALSIVPEGAFLPEEGQPSQYQALRLVDAIKRGADRSQQTRIAQVYWRLAIAQADYHFARDSVARLREATRGQLNQPALRAARCAMRALQRDAETLVIRAQNALAVDMNLPADAQMPLAIDLPHTGSYDTRFAQVYSGRTPPQRALLIDRTIPVRRQAIEEHALAIVESLDAVDASTDEYGKGTDDLTTLLLAFERLWKERKAFSGAVREYNQDIAEYALMVAPAQSDASSLVAMLIKPVGSNSPRTTTPGTAAPRGSTRYTDPEPADDEAPPKRDGAGGERLDRTFRSAPVDEEQSPPPRRREDGIRDPFGGRQTSYYQNTGHRNIDFDEQDAQRALWRALVDVDTPLRTQRLSNALHASEVLPKDGGRPTTLAECLTAVQPSLRRDAIAAYWNACEAVAVHQVLADEANELAALSQAATRIRNARGGPEAALRLQALRRTAKASLYDAQITLQMAQFELTRLCGGRLDGDWMLPETAPHGGRYLLRLDEQPQDLIAARRLDQLGLLVKVLHEQMEDHAGTVVYADSARATALRDPSAGPAAFDAAMALIERQAIHTVFFLRATTKYNLAIADYVMAVLPENVPAQKLTSALVLARG